MVSDSDRIGSYELLDLVGAGATGQVWRARASDGETVAIKVLRPELQNDPRIVQQFIAERSVLQQVQGHYVTRVRDLVIERGRLGIVMNYIAGGSLRDHLNRVGTLAPVDVCDVGAKVAQGITLLHAADLLHRDLKPENVLLQGTPPPWEPRLTDFGISQVIETNAATVVAGTSLVGTPAYIAPELIDGQVPTGACDVYALGVMLYEMLCGVTPFANPSMLTVLKRQAEQAPGRLEGIDDELWSVIADTLAKDPSQRPSAIRVSTRLNQLAPGLAGLSAIPALSEPPLGAPVYGVSTSATQGAHEQQTIITRTADTRSSGDARAVAPATAPHSSDGATPKRRPGWWLVGGGLAVAAAAGVGTAFALSGGHNAGAASSSPTSTVAASQTTTQASTTSQASSTAPASTVSSTTQSAAPTTALSSAASRGGSLPAGTKTLRGLGTECPDSPQAATVPFTEPAGSTYSMSCKLMGNLITAVAPYAGVTTNFSVDPLSVGRGPRHFVCDPTAYPGYTFCTSTPGGTQAWVPNS